MVEQGATALKVQHHVQLLLALERVVQFKDEGVLEDLSKSLLQLDEVSVVFLDDQLFIEHLHGVVAEEFRACDRACILLLAH